MKKGLLIFGTVLVLGAAAGSGYWYYTQNYAPVSENAVYVSEVSALTSANSGYINRYAGVVEAQETVEVNIESGRKVREVSVKAGDVVKKGQLLFEYDLSSIEQDLQQAKLDLEKLKNEAAGLENQIVTLEKEKKKASKDNQLSYTIEIETAKMNLKKNEYDQVSKQAEIDRLQNATVNTEVRSSLDGVIQKIDTAQLNSSDDSSVYDTMDDYGGGYYGYGNSSENNAFIKILSTGEYRVKGSVNELNIGFLYEGESIIIRSRSDETQTWHGVMGMIDRENAVSNNNNNYYWGMSDANDSETNSSSYPFYVEMDSSEGLMLGQHVYIEPDNGQMASKSGIWLSEMYIVDAVTNEPYVWAADSKNRLEKRKVVLGQYDAALGEYEIVSGLEKSDYLAFPDPMLEEGLPTTTDAAAAMDFGPEEEWSQDEEWQDEMGYDSMDGMDGTMLGADNLEEYGDLVEIEEFSADDVMIEPDFGDMEEFGDVQMIDSGEDEFIEEDMEAVG